jgi:hypothetical protein
MGSVPLPLPLALQRIDHEYLLFGGAALIGLIAFVALILMPAMSSYGRLWEKAVAALLSVFVLLALIGIGVVAGLAVVYYYDEIVKIVHG